MIGRLVPAVLLLVLFANYATAQNTSSSGVGFCTTAPQELLVALDGGWSLTQGMGAGTGRTKDGAIAFPLPPQAPVGMMLAFDPAIGAAIMSGDGQQMLMMPTMTETAAQALGPDFEDLVGSAASSAGCDWFALPTLVGTNTYSLSGGAASPELFEVLNVAEGFLIVNFCVDGARIDAIPLDDGSGFVFFGSDGFFGYDSLGVPLDIDLSHVQPDSSFECDQNLQPTNGDFKMTIALKFDSPSSGRGIVAFEGEMDGATFSAVAPVVMTR